MSPRSLAGSCRSLDRVLATPSVRRGWSSRLALLLACAACVADAAVTSTVVDIPVPGATQRYLLVAPDEPVAVIVSIPGGNGIYGIQPNGSMTTRVAQCSPVARARQALALRGIAVALVDADSRGLPWIAANIEAVMRDLQVRFGAPQYIMGGSASTPTTTSLAATLSGDLPGGVMLVSPGPPDTNTGRIVRPALVLYHSADVDQFGAQTFVALTSAVVREQVAFQGGNSSGCGHHLFDGLDAQFADAAATFIETHNHLFLQEPEPPRVVSVTVANAGALRQAVATANESPQQVHEIGIATSPLQLDALPPGNDALPVVTGTVLLTPSAALQGQGVVLRGGGPGSGFRLATVGQGGSLQLAGIRAEDFHGDGDGGVLAFGAGARGGVLERLGGVTIRNCSAAGDGGAIIADAAQSLRVAGLTVEDCSAGGSGGAIALRDMPAQVAEPSHVRRSGFIRNSARSGGAIHSDSAVEISGSRFTGNQAAEEGGALDLRGSGATAIERNRFDGNAAGLSGGTIHVAGSYLPGELRIAVNELRAGASVPPIALGGGEARLQFNTVDVAAGAAVFGRAEAAELQGNILNDRDLPTGSRRAAAVGKLLCDDAVAAGMVSLGANIATDAGCGFAAASDLVTTAPGLQADAEGNLGLAADAPALERGPSGRVAVAGGMELPCGYQDIRGLGRPQDADGDGVFACDSGAWELQAGAALSSRQSGAYYDPGRSGEGHLIELIGGGLAVVSTYTYGVDGGMAWFTGVGKVVGNSVVVDDMEITSGGVFGPEFDPDAVVRRRVGGASFVFPDCEAVGQPGHFAFQGNHPGEFEDLSTRANRLTAILPCSGNPSAQVHRSGSYYDPQRSGEGVFVQYLPNGSAVLVFYGYTPQGQQFWAISGSTTIAGNTLIAQMVYPAGTSRFGSNFAPDEVELQPWGTMALNHTGCNTATLTYNSTVAGYGSGSYDYSRLTAIEGANCP